MVRDARRQCLRPVDAHSRQLPNDLFRPETAGSGPNGLRALCPEMVLAMNVRYSVARDRPWVVACIPIAHVHVHARKSLMRTDPGAGGSA